MNDFTILHLSDLHIDSKGKSISLLLRNLLDDIKKEMEFSEHIIIVVTGDIINQANYESRESAVEFFRRLKEKLGDKVKQIYIVPGNHDKIRNRMDKEMMEKYTGDESDFYPDLWKYMRMGFDEYTDMIREIYGLYYDKDFVNERVFRDTFGVQIDEVNGKNICVLQLNTVWSCTGDQDERNLWLGKFQLNKIKESYEKKKAALDDKSIDLTIAIAHHPVNWLTGKDEDFLQAEMLSDVGLDTDLYICGHVHNRDVINWQNNRHSLTTLVSGIGWPDGSTSHPEAHNYSSYVFNLDVNSIDVYVRSSNDALTFEPDFRIYTQERNKRDNKIIMPINSCKTQAYFNLGTVAGRSPKACYITGNIICQLESFVRIFEHLQKEMEERLNIIKSDVCDVLCADLSSGHGTITTDNIYQLDQFWFKGDLYSNGQQEAKKICRKYKKMLQMHFSTYLQCMCIYLHNNIAKYLKKSEVRVHFRQLDVKNDSYIQNCIYGKDFEEYQMKPKKWGELLEKSYEAKRPLVASVNSMSCEQSLITNTEKTDAEKKWIDFITAIPDFAGNHYIQKDEKTGEIIKARPMLTFGITVYEEADRALLYMLDYLRIDKTIGKLIYNFLYYFPISLLHYIKDRTIKENNHDERKI